MSAENQITTDWQRQNVQVVLAPRWESVQTQERSWLWLNGNRIDDLEAQIQALTRRFDYHWVWRGTEWEYRAPGYRRGPMLVPLDHEALLTHFLDAWAPQGAGLLLQSSEPSDVLLMHLQQLHLLIGADGMPLSFSLEPSRQLEEIGEGLPSAQRAQLLGPIARLTWRADSEASTEWLQLDMPAHCGGTPLRTGEHLQLTHEDETALAQASYRWFIRDTARLFFQRYPAHTSDLTEQQLCNKLALIDAESDVLGLALERDARQYMALRLTYPKELFDRDATLRKLLCSPQMSARHRLLEAEEHLSRTARSKVESAS
ncbi:DUF4123 domain-containing protein [Pseudomonas sp. R5(2019)]|uniref:DUF4123 domain-containing protein n=1 Tax=Pseudomonas sp. R5(2019) TaxID=2697566 RepID=UPI0014136373|nr:hypothetical protein [Pseudomonas sp. R5(2019)]